MYVPDMLMVEPLVDAGMFKVFWFMKLVAGQLLLCHIVATYEQVVELSIVTIAPASVTGGASDRMLVSTT